MLVSSIVGDSSALDEAAPDGGQGRGEVRVASQFDARHPLDPLEAARAWGYEPNGCAVVVAERRAGNVCGEQETACVLDAEAPAVAGYRADGNVARGGVGADEV